MYARLVGLIVRRAFADLSAGNWQRPARMFAPDGVLRFPGDHPLAGEFRGRDAIAGWFDRGWSLFGFAFTVDDVAVAGPPWNLRVATRWRNDLRAKDGRLFPNRGMQYLRIRWFRILEDELYEDTQLVAEAIDHAESLAAEAAFAAR